MIYFTLKFFTLKIEYYCEQELEEVGWDSEVEEEVERGGGHYAEDGKTDEGRGLSSRTVAGISDDAQRQSVY
jgi:hypothetical protein